MKGTFDPRWYRRAFHTFAACFIVYYLIPENTGELLWVFITKRAVVASLIIALTLVEIMRLSGKIKTEVFFGLRLYEQKRVCSYIYFGIGSSLLLLFFPQAIAVPCILAAAITDPVMGELRRVAQRWVSLAFGAVVSFGLFMICNYDLLPAAVGAAFVVAGETASNKWIDDDLLMQILPAAVLAILAAFLPGAEIIPQPFITPLVYPW